MKTVIFCGRDKVHEAEAAEAVMPGLDGEFSVLDFHQPFLYRLRKGIMKLRPPKGPPDEKIIPITDGLAKFEDNTLLVLCEKEREKGRGA